MKIPSYLNLEIEGQYCLSCYSTQVQRIFKNVKTYYLCGACGITQERSLVIDSAVKWWLDEDGQYWHESIGTIVVNHKGQILCMMRQIFPFAYTIPAGHLDSGELPLVAAQREVFEETGLDILKENFELVDEFLLPGDSCRRGSDHHQWHLYKAQVDLKIVPVILNDEAANYKWLTVEQIRQETLVTFPLKYIVEHYNV